MLQTDIANKCDIAQTVWDSKTGSTSVGKYAGNFNGKDLIAAIGDAGYYYWGNKIYIGAASAIDGLSNTNIIKTSTWPSLNAANTCVNIGSGWYLPSTQELSYIGRIGYAIKMDPNERYWSSTEFWSEAASAVRWVSNTNLSVSKDSSYLVRCVRSF